MEMIINGTPEWTHMTRDGRKAVIVTDKLDDKVYNVMAVVEAAVGSNKFCFGYYTPELKYHADGKESKHDLRPYPLWRLWRLIHLSGFNLTVVGFAGTSPTSRKAGSTPGLMVRQALQRR